MCNQNRTIIIDFEDESNYEKLIADAGTYHISTKNIANVLYAKLKQS